MKFTEEYIGSTTINISGVEAVIHLYRNEKGNIERHIKNEEEICPEGTCTEVFNDEMVIYKFEG